MVIGVLGFVGCRPAAPDDNYVFNQLRSVDAMAASFS